MSNNWGWENAGPVEFVHFPHDHVHPNEDVQATAFVEALKGAEMIARRDEFNNVPDDELLRRAVITISSRKTERHKFAWVAVMDAFRIGATLAAQLCERSGIDPDTGEVVAPKEQR